jgi:hypothetical protein
MMHAEVKMGLRDYVLQVLTKARLPHYREDSRFGIYE